jgi:hypothetical protein
VKLALVLVTALAAHAPQEELQERAREIVRKSQQNEITTSEARRRVQILLKDLKKWSEAEGVELEPRTRIFNTPATGKGEILTVDRCALFYEETLEQLCPLDIALSEVWGAAVLFCRYVCVPSSGEE